MTFKGHSRSSEMSRFDTVHTTLLPHDSLSLSLLWLQPWSLLTTMLLWHSFLIIIIILPITVIL